MKDETKKPLSEAESPEKVEEVPEEQYNNYFPKEKVITQNEKTTEKNKAKMANVFGGMIIGGFVFSIVINLICCVVFKTIPTNDTIELMKTITNTFGTPLGFVLGYFYGVMRSK
ncbi:MAG TPA: hypothetical protein VHY08_03125 [Bacillota bacterium]|nr:hypothetical protein [Bacillota bacterium]